MPKKKKDQKLEEGDVEERKIVKEMKESYIDYAMSVIVSRALPDVRDGLKPVQRRILYAMLDEGLRHDAKFRKSATVVGSVLGKYHPHGDQAVYKAAVRMAQDFSLRYLLIQGQGNMGSLDDPNEFAAMRYTEMRLSNEGEKMLEDIKKETVDFVDNYDGTREEPVVLPSPFPQLLLNGCTGIAVGMATSIPPHNLNELCDAIIYLIDHPDANTEDLFEFVQGPDFPTGTLVYDQEGIIEAYSQGKGPILIRAKTDIVKSKRGGAKILITEIPYHIRKSTLLEQCAKLVSKEKIKGIKDIRDESDKEGTRIVVELKRGINPRRVLNRLFKFTYLQTKFHLNMVALVDGIQPRTLNFVEVLSYFIEHRKDVVTRRAKHELEKAKERAHILEGLHKCLSKIDAVIETIKKSDDRESAKKNLMKKFKLTEIQADAILDTKLVALAKLERKKIEDELKELKAQIKELTALLKSPAKIKGLIKKELKQLKEEFGDERRTKIFKKNIRKISTKDLVPKEETIITLTQGGYIKRMSPKAYKSQRRGGKGLLGLKTVGEDVVSQFLSANTHDQLLFFTDSGKVFKIPAYEIPKARRVAKGRGIQNFLELSGEEKVLSIISLDKDIEDSEVEFLVMATKKGKVKKTALEEFKNIRRSGLIAISLKKGDVLKEVGKTDGKDEIILATKKGQSIRFSEEDVRPMGRTAMGVKGIELKRGDEVIGMDVIQDQDKEKKEKGYLLVVTERGYGKRTSLKNYRSQSRGGIGLKTADLKKKKGDLVASEVLTGVEKDLIAISKHGKVIRIKIDSISKQGRATQGVRVMKLEKGDQVVSILCV
ncbi:MAG: DNA gyrase subunit A [Candidatus Nealsonbacteria bacterium]|nr:DNA gyrase subunit A [Candidatus Nealsonbacteria bacterium]